MTDGQEPASGAGRVTPRPSVVIIRSVLRAVGSVIVLVTVYYLLPLDTSAAWVAITILVTGLVVLMALIAYSVWSILRAPYPGLRAIEALAVIVPLFLLLFASAYVVMERLARASFSQPLTHTDALYFTVTVFTTVGFGDITARTETARVLVTIQMIMDLVIIGVAIQAIIGAARHRHERRPAGSSLSWWRPDLLTSQVRPPGIALRGRLSTNEGFVPTERALTRPVRGPRVRWPPGADAPRAAAGC